MVQLNDVLDVKMAKIFNSYRLFIECTDFFGQTLFSVCFLYVCMFNLVGKIVQFSWNNCTIVQFSVQLS